MSMNPHYYVLYGVALSESEFPGDKFDDKWLPYVEGHEGVEMSILYGEDGGYLYCGKVLAYASYDENFQHKEFSVDLLMKQGVTRWMRDELNCFKIADFMLVCLWR